MCRRIPARPSGLVGRTLGARRSNDSWKYMVHVSGVSLLGPRFSLTHAVPPHLPLQIPTKESCSRRVEGAVEPYTLFK